MTSAISPARQALQDVEHEGGAVALVHLRQRLLDERHGPGALELVDARGGLLEPGVAAAVEAPARAQLVEAGVGRHAEEPGAEPEGLGIRRRQPAERLDEDLLGHVPGLLPVPEDSRAEVVDGRRVLAVEALEGVAASGPEAAHEVGVCGGMWASAQESRREATPMGCGRNRPRAQGPAGCGRAPATRGAARSVTAVAAAAVVAGGVMAGGGVVAAGVKTGARPVWRAGPVVVLASPGPCPRGRPTPAGARLVSCCAPAIATVVSANTSTAVAMMVLRVHCISLVPTDVSPVETPEEAGPYTRPRRVCTPAELRRQRLRDGIQRLHCHHAARRDARLESRASISPRSGSVTSAPA